MQVIINDAIVLIGTAHISQKSIDEVKTAIDSVKPDVVAIELCQRRYDSLTKKDIWENTPVTNLLKSNNAYFLLAQTFLASLQRKLGTKYGIEPGSEMIAAIHEADTRKIPIELIDRDIAVTLKRAWARMGFREKLRLLWEFIKAMVGFDEEDLEEIDIDQLMDQDIISKMMEELGEIAPSVTEVLINERDTFIAQRIKDIAANGKKIVAVVGAGHLNGIKRYLEAKDQHVNVSDLESVPKKRISIGKVVSIAIPVIFAFVVFWLIFTRGPDAFGQIGNIFLWWFLIHGVFSALGAAIARGHPLSIATAFISAPFTSLEPFFAPGWFAGFVEAKLRPPVIKDFQNISKIENLRDFWNNKVIRLLMVVALANLGSIIGTVFALPYIIHIGLSS